MDRRLALLAFLGCAVTTALGFLVLARRVAALTDGAAVSSILLLSLALLVPALVAAWLLPRVAAERSTFLLVLLVGAAARLLFIPIDPGFSDDPYRYLWDGRVQLAGWNPYGIAPEDPTLDAVEDRWPSEERVRSRVNHPETPTIYPPLCQHVFAAIAAFGGGLTPWKWVLLGLELLLVLLIVRRLEGTDRDPRWSLLYLWHPLPVVEIAWNAHAELLGVVPFIWCVVLLTEERRPLAGVALGGAIAAKLWPAAFGLVLLKRGGVLAGVAAAATVAWLTFPFASVEWERASAGLREYAESWYFNDLVFRPLGARLGLDPEDRTMAGTRLLRLGLLAAWVAIAVATHRRPVVSAALFLTGTFVLLSPTVHPWYLLYVLPLAVLAESWGWWLLSGTVLIAYEVQIGWRAAGVWEEGAATRGLVYAAPLALIGWALLAGARARRERSLPEGGPSSSPPASPGGRSGSP